MFAALGRQTSFACGSQVSLDTRGIGVAVVETTHISSVVHIRCAHLISLSLNQPLLLIARISGKSLGYVTAGPLQLQRGLSLPQCNRAG